MKNNKTYRSGQVLELRPFMRFKDDIKAYHHYDLYTDLFVENVVFIGYDERTDNAVIEDTRGNIRLCNMEDLRMKID